VKHFDAAIDFIKQNPSNGLDVTVLKKVHSNGSEPVKLVTDCKICNESIIYSRIFTKS